MTHIDRVLVENPKQEISSDKDVLISSESPKKSSTVIKVRRCKHDSPTESAHFTLWVSRPYIRPEPDELTYPDKVSKPQGRTIQVKGLPAFTTKASLYRIFGTHNGEELDIDVITILPAERSHLLGGENPFSSSHSHFLGYQHAYIAYFDGACVDTVLNMPPTSNDYYFLASDDQPMYLVWATGLNTPYNFDYSKRLQHHTQSMKKHDERIKDRRDRRQTDANVPDEDGWVKVTVKRPRYARKFRGNDKKGLEMLTDRIGRYKKKFKKKRSTELLHFYRSEIQEEKDEKIKELQSKFNEDRRKIQEMKTQRKYKSY